MALYAASTHNFATTNNTSRGPTATTPQVGDLIVVIGGFTGNTATPTVTDDQGGTYTEVSGGGFTKAGSADKFYVWVRDQLCASITTHNVTMTPSGSHSGGGFFLVRLRGLTRAGASAVRQIAVHAEAAAGVTNATFASACLTGNPTFVALFNATNPPVGTVSGWSSKWNAGYATPTTGAAFDSRDSGFTGTNVQCSTNSATAYCMVAIEFDTSAAGYELVVDPGSYALSGSASQVVSDRLVSTSPGSYAQSGSSAGALAGRALSALPGSHTLAGDDTALVYVPAAGAFELNGDPGGYSLSGSAIAVLRALIMGLSPGSYGVTGAGAGIPLGRVFSASPGSYVLAGASSALAVSHAYILAVAPGSYALSGDAVGVKRGYNLSASPGSVSTLGAATQLRLTYVAALAPGAYGVFALGADLAQRIGFHPLSPGDLELIPDPPGATTIDPADQGSLASAATYGVAVYGASAYGAGAGGLVPIDRGELTLVPDPPG